MADPSASAGPDVPSTGVGTLTKKAFTSDQEVRWCPGCGDYAILAAVQSFLPELGIEPHKTVFVSGIGCSGRFTYYMDTYGVHGIHGRAPAIATGIATADPELSVWVVTGDGDALSIGGNHLIHALRRNVDLKILLFNNQIYGLTKGQYSPTSEEGKITKSTPFGSVDHPFNPIALALGAEATFVARTLDNDRQHLTDILRQAAGHKGTAFVEIYQNCNVFNDGAFDLLRDKPQGTHNQIRLVHGEPIIFDEGNRCVAVGENGRLVVADVADTPADRIITHDVHGRPSLGFGLAHLSHGPTEPTAIGVFREFERPVYGEAMHAQLTQATERLGKGELDKLLHSGDTWTV
ncbi:MAG: 2-oxoglutarate/2-oxoacid ferredoxin oxidoreductase subunit beta [Actinomycetota bacterium]|jgi:2-oxoglutarate ferredoxin oxidoreductase subunit beta|nr:2-oxoglutarate/2-oxoacid ferredoxin oxidoreductase subunit beta [Actinomycetota bacterium]MEA2580338.1 2-oxoglutarate/2-oxoacid ferredoxin oxidoreductase subunit beta [Actinomycetota bacterium]